MLFGLFFMFSDFYRLDSHNIGLRLLNNILRLLFFHFFLINFNSRSYGLLVFSQSCKFNPMCVDSYHSNFIHYVNREAQEYGK